MTCVALTIAGSDPSGGAGIQADLRTFNALGVVGVSVISALTVQNSLGVQSVHPVPAEVLAAQLEAIFSDSKIDAVKIGMLGGAEQVRVVADALRKYAPPNVVLDPVLASTGGVPLLDEAGRKALVSELMPLCDLVTPNLAEAATLTGLPVGNLDEMQAAGERLMLLGARGVLVKGGHLSGAPQDLLLLGQRKSEIFTSRRVETPHTHGTGCFLSSAMAAHLAKQCTLAESVQLSKELLTGALLTPIVTGQGRGYPDIGASLRTMSEHRERTHSDRVALLQGLYVVTDSNLRPDRTLSEVAAAALVGGAKTIQMRDKSLPLRLAIDIASDLINKGSAANALFIVNDRVDVALASDADGVHLGPDDMRPEDARRMLGHDKLVGVSVASVKEAGAAAPYASYFGVGAIYGSKTKLDAGEPIGVGRIREIKAAFPKIPIVAIGGITLDNIADVAAAGAEAAAVVSAVVQAPDMEVATRELVWRFQTGKRQSAEVFGEERI